jgi:hypothetical protein
VAKELSLLLEPASTAKAACRAVVDWLAADPALMPSIYLERGGRLRCQAVTRYWQVFDGIPPGTGVIGQTFQSGTPTIVADTGASDDYLEAVPSVRGEACVPMRAGGHVIGVLNVESERPLPDAVADTLTWCAELLGRRIEALGGQPLESRAQRLARHASHLSTLRDAAAILGEVTIAACDIAGMESALLAFPEADERSDPVAHGPHAERLAALPPAALRQVAGWVESMTSVYTIGEPAGRGFAGHEVLRQAGAEAIVVLRTVAATGPGACCFWCTLSRSRCRPRTSSCSSSWPRRRAARCRRPTPSPTCTSGRRRTRLRSLGTRSRFRRACRRLAASSARSR